MYCYVSHVCTSTLLPVYGVSGDGYRRKSGRYYVVLGVVLGVIFDSGEPACIVRVSAQPHVRLIKPTEQTWVLKGGAGTSSVGVRWRRRHGGPGSPHSGARSCPTLREPVRGGRAAALPRFQRGPLPASWQAAVGSDEE